jgi:hypothetical protein
MTKWMVGLVALLTLVLAPSAWADYGRVDQFADQPADGSAVHQQRIAVNATTHAAYVADTVGDQIRVFTPSGTNAAEGTPFGAGDLTDPLGIAVDQDTGDVYVSDDDDVLKYSSAGVRDNTFPSLGVTGPLAFDQAANELVVGDGTVVRRFSTVGVAGATFDGTSGSSAFAGIQDVAADSAGNVVVVDADGIPAQGTGTSRVERFAVDGTHQLTFGPVSMAATVAVEPGTDRVVVSGNQDGNVRGELPTVQVFDPAAPGTIAATATLPDALMYSAVRAVAFDGSRLYVGTDVGDYFGGFDYGSITIQVFEAGPDPRVVAPSNITTTGATLNATINPQGGGTDTTYRFELSTDGGATWNAVDPDSDGDENAGQGTTATPVSENITGLTSSSGYSVRLIATRGPVTITTPARNFATADIGPEATTGTATVTDVTAALRGRVKANGGATTYVFEYGTTTSYGRSFPAPAASAGAERNLYHRALATLTGLQPSTTYHYRLVATNGGATATGDDATFTTRATPAAAGVDTCPNAAIRAQQHAQRLPECRAYEQVSPIDKHGIGVHYAGTTQSAAAGDAVAFAVNGDLGDATTSLQFGYYTARRDQHGWTTASTELPQMNNTPLQIMNHGTVFFADDLSAALRVSTLALAPGAIAEGGNLYHQDDLTGRLTTLVATSGATATAFKRDLVSQGIYRGAVFATSNLSHFAFTNVAELIPGIQTDEANAYDYTDGELRVINRAPGTNALMAEGGTVRAMSADGRRIFFTSGTANGFQALYVRIDGTTTRLISRSQRPGDDPSPVQVAPWPSQILASADGSSVYFVTSVALTPDLPADDSGRLYRYEVATDTLSHVSTHPVGLPNVPPRGLVAVSPDGKTVYFQAQRALTEDAPDNDETTLYVWRNGQIRYVGRLDPALTARMSPNGRYFAFGDFNGGSTGFDAAGCAGPGSSMCAEVFVYDAEADSVSCATCRFTGTRNGAAQLSSEEVSMARGVSNHETRAMLNDGRAFFTSGEGLVPADVNGRDDVYEWKDGMPRLISPGTANADATFQEVSPDGTRVFFTTTERLVGQDRDTLTDMYVASVGGGFASPAGSDAGESTCDGDACQGRPMAPVAVPAVGSVAFGGGDTTSPRPTAGRLRVTRSAVKGSRFKLRVAVPAAGLIRTTGANVRAVSKKATRAGTYTLDVRLSAKATQALRKKRALKTSVRVTYITTAGRTSTVSLTVTFKAR